MSETFQFKYVWQYKTWLILKFESYKLPGSLLIYMKISPEGIFTKIIPWNFCEKQEI